MGEKECGWVGSERRGGLGERREAILARQAN